MAEYAPRAGAGQEVAAGEGGTHWVGSARKATLPHATENSFRARPLLFSALFFTVKA